MHDPHDRAHVSSYSPFGVRHPPISFDSVTGPEHLHSFRHITVPARPSQHGAACDAGDSC